MSDDCRSGPGPLFLVGYMASGKTTLGRALAEAAGLIFIDLDQYIEHSEGRTVTEIFAHAGEDHFRRLETEALDMLIRRTDADRIVIACGGGTPCFADNMTRMNNAGLTVWLDAKADVIVRRLIADRSSRPIVAKLSEGDELNSFVADSLAVRNPYYSRAKGRFDSSRLETPRQIADSVAQFIALFIKAQ